MQPYLDGLLVILRVQGNPNAAAQALGAVGVIVQGQMGDQIQVSLPIDRIDDVTNLPEVRTILPPAVVVPQ
jgi:uncharacterized protein involved in propanediol utilization